jgi:ADP-ribose diphosphatase
VAESPKITDTRVVAESRLFQIEEVDLAFGKRGMGAVMMVPMLDPHTFLLVREYAVGLERYELGFPKGLLEVGEALHAAATRELMEEVGYRPNRLVDLGRLSAAPGYMSSRMPIVLALDLVPATAQGDEPEPIEVVPWRVQDIPALLARDDFSEARSIAALYLTLNYLQQNQ